MQDTSRCTRVVTPRRKPQQSLTSAMQAPTDTKPLWQNPSKRPLRSRNNASDNEIDREEVSSYGVHVATDGKTPVDVIAALTFSDPGQNSSMNQKDHDVFRRWHYWDEETLCPPYHMHHDQVDHNCDAWRSVQDAKPPQHDHWPTSQIATMLTLQS